MIRPLIIAIDGRELATGGSTGIGRYLKNFLESECRRKSPHSYVILGDRHTPDPGLTGTEFRRIVGGWSRLWDQVSLPAALRRVKPDVFLSPYDKAPFWAPCPVIATFHDLLFLNIPHIRGPASVLYGLAYQIERRVLCRRLAQIHTVSKCSRHEIVRILRASDRRVCVTYNGIDDRFRRVSDPSVLDSVRRRYGLPEKPILYVGNFKPHKNIARLVKAFALLPHDVQRRHPLVLGGILGRYGESLKADVARRGFGNVLFVGRIADTDLPALYSAAELFAFPSLQEGFGMPPLEAMACGTPVVASNASSLPEVLGDAAFMVDANDVGSMSKGLHLMLSNQSSRKAYIDAGLRRSRRYSVDEAAGRILRALSAVVSPAMSSDIGTG